MKIVRIKNYTKECFEGVYKLLDQLYLPGENKLRPADLKDSLKNPYFILLAAIDTKKKRESYTGMGTISFQKNMQVWTAEMNDVVVDKAYRGKGIGEAIVKALLKEAGRLAKAKKSKVRIQLTSQPKRIPANNLYKKIGLTLVAKAHGEWGTNLFKRVIEP